MTVTFNMFLNKENIIGCYFSICAISYVTFVCILYRVIFACCAGMFVWLYQITRTWCQMNVMHLSSASPRGRTPGWCGGIRGLYGDFATNFCPCGGGNVGTLIFECPTLGKNVGLRFCSTETR